MPANRRAISDDAEGREGDHRRDALIAKPCSAWLLVSLLTASSIIVALPIDAQPVASDWVVTGTQVIENTSVNLDGNLTIESGGSLTLINVRLTLNPQDDSQTGILADEGSSFFVYNCNISSATSFRFFFSIVNATFVMRGGELEGAGTGTPWDTDGLRVHANGAIVEGVFIHNGWGIRLDSAHSSKVMNCTLETDYGICLPHSQNERDVPSYNLILGNTILHPTDFGIMTSGHDDVYANNTVIDTEGGASIWSGSGYNNLITGNHIVIEHTFDVWGAIALWGKSYNNTVRGNHIKYDHPPDRRSPLTGIEVRYSSYNCIEDNAIFGAQIGVMVFYSYSNVVVFNEITNVTYGTAGTDNLYIPSCDAIQLYHASGNFIGGNNLSSVDNNAILLWENSTNNTIQANVVDKAYDGIMLHYSSDNNTIVNNALSGIVSWSVVLDECSGNVLHGNNFEDPHVKALDNGRNNWNSSLEGNYWGDYGGIDSDGDGIGDDPYSI
ncbi:MAG: right-handed parallel beta-helix repeat-containing protein, partial [Methanomassiliicoccales archaeon]|nr:right-handed parallel beta-helix repeat-containing protein [Methanomassiliicoccales archaeon]